MMLNVQSILHIMQLKNNKIPEKKNQIVKLKQYIYITNKYNIVYNALGSDEFTEGANTIDRVAKTTVQIPLY